MDHCVQKTASEVCLIDTTQRGGVPVSRPPRNTLGSPIMFEVIHQGFDGFDVAFKTQIRPQFASILEEARDRAVAARAPQLVTLNDISMHVGESGAKGGYRYACDTGPLGANWFFKKPTPRDDWGIRVSIRALPLAQNGIESVSADLLEIVSALGGEVQADCVSISRVDYAIDYFFPGFDLSPDQFVMHSRLTRTVDRETSEVGRSGRVHSIRIGKMPGQQVVLYDKRADVLAKGKRVWWEIWNGNLATHGLPPIAPDETRGCTWRAEMRAGKEFLKERQGIRTWEEFKRHGGNALASIADAIRYVAPSEDANRARWPTHPLWLDVQTRLRDGLAEVTSPVSTDRVREIIRADRIEALDHQLIRCAASQLVALGFGDVELADQSRLIAKRLAKQIEAKPDRFREKLTAAADRYHFI